MDFNLEPPEGKHNGNQRQGISQVIQSYKTSKTISWHSFMHRKTVAVSSLLVNAGCAFISICQLTSVHIGHRGSARKTWHVRSIIFIAPESQPGRIP